MNTPATSPQPRLCTVYKSDREKELYLYVNHGTDLPKSIPQDLLERLGNTSEVLTLKLSPERKLARVDASRVLEAIDEQGFYLQLPPANPADAPLP